MTTQVCGILLIDDVDSKKKLFTPPSISYILSFQIMNEINIPLDNLQVDIIHDEANPNKAAPDISAPFRIGNLVQFILTFTNWGKWNISITALNGYEIRPKQTVTVELYKQHPYNERENYDIQQVTGIYPKLNAGIVDYNLTDNALDIDVEEGCRADYYGKGCILTTDYMALNAIASELGNLVNFAGLKYDCKRLDNLAHAVDLISIKNFKNRYLVGHYTEQNSASVSDSVKFFPYDVYPRYTLQQLQEDVLKKTVNKDLLNKALLIEANFDLPFDSDIYFKFKGFCRELWDQEITNYGFLAISLDDTFELYEEGQRGANYSLKNLGIFNIYNPYIHLKTAVYKKVKAGKHSVKVFAIQYNDVPFPTDIKQRENLPRIRVDKKNPRTSLDIWRVYD